MRKVTVVGLLGLLLLGGAASAWAGAAGRYAYTSSWDGRGQPAKIVYDMALDANHDATFTMSLEGNVIANPYAAKRYGRVANELAASRRVVHRGTWRERGDNVTISLKGAGSWRTETLAANAYGNNLYLTAWNHSLYGDTPRFNFVRASNGGDSTKHSIVAGAILVGLGLLLHNAIQNKPTDANERLRGELQTRLTSFAEAMERADWRAMTSPMPDDFRYYDTNGNALTRREWSLRMRELEDILISPKVTMTLSNLNVGGGQANGLVKVKIQSDVDEGGRTSHLEAEETDRVNWVNRGSKWVTTAVRILNLQQLIDGREVGRASLMPTD